MEFETEKIEFKSMFTENIYKEVIAFANTDGGVLYVDIDNEGNAVGLKDIDNEFTKYYLCQPFQNRLILVLLNS
ncbi:MAG: ATP-binding protein [Ruminococcus sp.]|nr:ATP-binding protein [Ruminococcus sp.]